MAEWPKQKARLMAVFFLFIYFLFLFIYLSLSCTEQTQFSVINEYQSNHIRLNKIKTNKKKKKTYCLKAPVHIKFSLHVCLLEMADSVFPYFLKTFLSKISDLGLHLQKGETNII